MLLSLSFRPCLGYVSNLAHFLGFFAFFSVFFVSLYNRYNCQFWRCLPCLGSLSCRGRVYLLYARRGNFWPVLSCRACRGSQRGSLSGVSGLGVWLQYLAGGFRRSPYPWGCVCRAVWSCLPVSSVRTSVRLAIRTSVSYKCSSGLLALSGRISNRILTEY